MRFLLKAGVLVAAAWYVFSPAFRGDWLWDDFEIRDNPTLRDWRGLARMWFSPGTPDYYPLKTTVQWVQWHLWRDNLVGYHITNAALHLLSAFLIWHVLKKLGVRFAWLGGLLFVVHPMMVESVAWVAEVKNTLSLPLLLLAFSFWIDWNNIRWGGLSPTRSFDSAGETTPITLPNEARSGQRAPPFYALALLCFLAAMLCKSSVVMFPAILLLYAWWRRGRIGRADVLASLPFFAISCALGAVTVWFQQHRAIANWSLPRENFASRLADAGLAVEFYFTKFFFPRGLMPIYPRWTFSPSSFVPFLPWLILGAAVALCWMKRKTYGRHALFGLGWFVLNLVPVLGFVPMSYLHVASVADHFAYLPLVGLIGLAVAGAGAFSKRRTNDFEQEDREGSENRNRTLPDLSHLPVQMALIISVVIVALAIESRSYAKIFINQETLWAYNLRLNPRSPAVYLNLAFIQHHDGQWAAAAANYETAIRLNPDDAQAEDELAGLLIDENEQAEAIPHYEKAIVHYQRALQLDPTLLETRRSLAKSLAKVGQTAEAMAQYRQILREHPDDPEIETDLGKALGDAGRQSEAMAHYETALRLDRRNAEAENSLGLALAGDGRSKDAIAHLERALELNPDFAEAQNNLGFTLTGIGRSQEAITHFEQALRIKPNFGQAHNNLGFALAGTGRSEEAIVQFEEALKLKPEDPAAHYNLAMLLGAAGRTQEAIGHLETALRLKPDFPGAQAALARLRMVEIATGK